MSMKLNSDILQVCKELKANGMEPVPGFTVHPSDGTDLVMRTAEEALLNGAKVSKLHCSVGGYSVLNENLESYFQLAEKIGFPIVTHLGASITGHTSTPELSDLEHLLIRYPKMKLILAHSASPAVSDSIALAKQYSNLYLDTTPTVTRTVPYPRPDSSDPRGNHQDLLDLARNGRVLFGSDLPNVAVRIEETIRHVVLTFGSDRDREFLSQVGGNDLEWLRQSQEYRRGPGDPVYEVLVGAQHRLVEGIDLSSLRKEKDWIGKL